MKRRWSVVQKEKSVTYKSLGVLEVSGKGKQATRPDPVIEWPCSLAGDDSVISLSPAWPMPLAAVYGALTSLLLGALCLPLPSQICCEMLASFYQRVNGSSRKVSYTLWLTSSCWLSEPWSYQGSNTSELWYLNSGPRRGLLTILFLDVPFHKSIGISGAFPGHICLDHSSQLQPEVHEELRHIITIVTGVVAC